MMHITPVAGIGTIVTGPTQEHWADLRAGGHVISTTRFPHGRATYPLVAGINEAILGEDVARIQVDPRLVPRLGGGPYELRGQGTLYVWVFDGDAEHGLLAGDPPLASAQDRIDVRDLDVPHGHLHLAVQVRVGDRHGPVHFVSSQPVPQPAQVSVDHDVGSLGPRSHLVLDPGEVPQVELTIERHIRQTGVSSTSTYEVHHDANKITFDDLLHGDRLTLRVNAPYALADDDGEAVQDLVYQYHAVPETRLVVAGGGTPVGFVAGINPMPVEEVRELLGDALQCTFDEPTWREEWPEATQDGMDSISDALKMAGVPTAPADGGALRWWLQVIETGQSVDHAQWLRSLRLVTPPTQVDAVAGAARFLEGFPAHIFKEIDADADVAPGVTSFQERLGIQDQKGIDVVRLAKSVHDALRSGAATWANTIRQANLHWLDGAVVPLQDSPTLERLQQLVVRSPGDAVGRLREARQAIWQIARHSDTGLENHADLESRRALLEWHLQQNRERLERVVQFIRSTGVNLPDRQFDDVPQLASYLNHILRGADVAIARVAKVPTLGPAFVVGAARDGAEFAEDLLSVLDVWCHVRVPAAIRTPAQRLVQTLQGQDVERLAVWHAFLQDRDTLVREVTALATSPGDTGKRATRVGHLFEDAVRHQDPVPFAQAAADFAKIESGLMEAREAWESAIHGCSTPTREALGLLPGQGGPWESVVRRIGQDAAEVRVLGELLNDHTERDDVRLEGVLRTNGELDRVLQEVESAGPDIERARAVTDYDRLRTKIGGWFGTEDTISSLRTAYVAKVADDVRIMLRRRLGRLSEATMAALQTFPDIDGTRELGILSRYLEMADTIDPTTPEAVADAERIGHLMDHVRQSAGDPWRRVQEAIMLRLNTAFGELARYLGDRAPDRKRLTDADDALEWLHCLATGGRDPLTGTDIATMLPGTRRLIHHTLKERGLWLA